MADDGGGGNYRDERFGGCGRRVLVQGFGGPGREFVNE